MRHLAHFRRFGGQVAPLGAFEPLPAQSCATWRVQTTLSPKLRHLTRANGSQPRLRHLTRFRRFGAKVAPLEASRTAPAKVAPLDATQTDVVRRHLPGECNNLAWGAQHRRTALDDVVKRSTRPPAHSRHVVEKIDGRRRRADRPAQWLKRLYFIRFGVAASAPRVLRRCSSNSA